MMVPECPTLRKALCVVCHLASVTLVVWDLDVGSWSLQVLLDLIAGAEESVEYL